MEFKDYYKILGIENKADEKDIKAAFKKLAKKYHPDSETGSEERFKEINEAYDVLQDKNKRSRYDYMYGNFKAPKTNFNSKTQTFKQNKMYSDLGSFTEFYKQKEQENRNEEARKRHENEQKQESNFSDFFETFFGKQKQQANETAAKKPIKGDDYEMDLELSLEDAYHGSIRKIEITGTTASIKRLEVSIPAGVRNGTKIKVANEGKLGKQGGVNGDLYLKVRLKEHEQFWLDGDDVHSNLLLEPYQAVLGTTIKIPTLEDIVELVIPPKTHNDRILRLRSKGLKNSKGERLGDHYVHVKIDIPNNFTDEELKTYQYLEELSKRKK
jgi:DnaJ-class molecular chaperone